MAQIEITRNIGADVAHLPLALSGYAEPRGVGLLPWQVKRVRDYVDGDLGGRPSVKAAAGRARLSPSYFARCFRQSFGLTFSKFVAQRRIELAQAMMIRSSSSLCQIGLACGFSDQAHFTRTFGGVTGSTPSRWRRNAMQYDGPADAIGSC
ncbi:hypothetical protein BH10PSE3_BH10PSE3_24440 [soil metagenome]